MQTIRRNDPCPCGSGKKYKKCCLSKNDNSPFLTKANTVCLAIVAILLVSVFLRFYGFQKPHGLTFDEGLYSEFIAEQLMKDPLNYSTQEAYRYQTSLGGNIPKYLDRPLFKHPPLYNYFIALSYKLFGSSHLSAVSVSIMFGSLMILIVFLLGRELYDDRVGILAAFFLCIDPVHWICSEKIWMETTMSFFMLAAVYLFVLGQKRKVYMVLSGLSVGLAMLTKYPGALAFLAIISFAMFFDRSLFKQKYFWVLCFVSILVFSPWIIWNWSVYDNLNDAFLSAHIVGAYWKKAIKILSEHKGFLSGFSVLAVFLFIIRNKISSFFGDKPSASMALARRRLIPVLGILVFICAYLASQLFRDVFKGIFIWTDTFRVGWVYPFAGESWHFYIKRLNEFSPTYLFSFFSIFFIFGKNRGDRLLILTSILILAAFSLIGSYQSRYILPAIPFLLLLSARWLVWAYDKLVQNNDVTTTTPNAQAYRALLNISLMGVVVYFIIKTLRTGWLLAIGPDFGYF